MARANAVVVHQGVALRRCGVRAHRHLLAGNNGDAGEGYSRLAVSERHRNRNPPPLPCEKSLNRYGRRRATRAMASPVDLRRLAQRVAIAQRHGESRRPSRPLQPQSAQCRARSPAPQPVGTTRQSPRPHRLRQLRKQSQRCVMSRVVAQPDLGDIGLVEDSRHASWADDSERRFGQRSDPPLRLLARDVDDPHGIANRHSDRKSQKRAPGLGPVDGQAGVRLQAIQRRGDIVLVQPNGRDQSPPCVVAVANGEEELDVPVEQSVRMFRTVFVVEARNPVVTRIEPSACCPSNRTRPATE